MDRLWSLKGVVEVAEWKNCAPMAMLVPPTASTGKCRDGKKLVPDPESVGCVYTGGGVKFEGPCLERR